MKNLSRDDFVLIVVLVLVIAVIFGVFLKSGNGSNEADGTASPAIEYGSLTIGPAVPTIITKIGELSLAQAFCNSSVVGTPTINGYRIPISMLLVGKVKYFIDLQSCIVNVDERSNIVHITVDTMYCECELLFDHCTPIETSSGVSVNPESLILKVFETLADAKQDIINQSENWGVRESAEDNAKIILDGLFVPLGYETIIVWENTFVKNVTSSETLPAIEQRLQQ